MMDLLNKILKFNPFLRYSAHESLNHPVFDKIRDRESEFESKAWLFLDVDQDGAFDYEKNESNIYNHEYL